jgi:hypothetical protein
VLLALATAGAAAAAHVATLPARASCPAGDGGIIFEFQSRSGYVAEATDGRAIAGESTQARALVARGKCHRVAALALAKATRFKRFPYAEGVVGCRKVGTARIEVQVDAVPGGHRIAVYRGHVAQPLAYAVTATRGTGMWFDPRRCRVSP